MVTPYTSFIFRKVKIMYDLLEKFARVANKNVSISYDGNGNPVITHSYEKIEPIFNSGVEAENAVEAIREADSDAYLAAVDSKYPVGWKERLDRWKAPLVGTIVGSGMYLAGRSKMKNNPSLGRALKGLALPVGIGTGVAAMFPSFTDNGRVTREAIADMYKQDLAAIEKLDKDPSFNDTVLEAAKKVDYIGEDAARLGIQRAIQTKHGISPLYEYTVLKG